MPEGTEVLGLVWRLGESDTRHGHDDNVEVDFYVHAIGDIGATSPNVSSSDPGNLAGSYPQVSQVFGVINTARLYRFFPSTHPSTHLTRFLEAGEPRRHPQQALLRSEQDR
jgi:hypothetical protein